MRTLFAAIMGLLLGVFMAGANMGLGKFADVDLLNPRTSAAQAHRMEVETAQQDALFQVKLEDERLRREEERARERQRFEEEMMMKWAAFGVGAVALLVLAGAGAFYLITLARVYSQAAGPVPHPSHRARASVAPLRPGNGNGHNSRRAPEVIGAAYAKPRVP